MVHGFCPSRLQKVKIRVITKDQALEKANNYLLNLNLKNRLEIVEQISGCLYGVRNSTLKTVGLFTFNQRCLL